MQEVHLPDWFLLGWQWNCFILRRGLKNYSHSPPLPYEVLASNICSVHQTLLSVGYTFWPTVDNVVGKSCICWVSFYQYIYPLIHKLQMCLAYVCVFISMHNNITISLQTFPKSKGGDSFVKYQVPFSIRKMNFQIEQSKAQTYNLDNV